MEPASPPPARVPQMGCGYAACAGLVLGGGALLWLAPGRWQAGRTPEAWVLGGLGALLCAIGLGLIAPMQRAAARARERQRREQAEPHKPWTWDPMWTDERGVPQARRRSGALLLIIGLVFLGISLPIVALALPQEIARRNYGVLFVLLFPVIGGWIVALAALDAVRRRKYGVARFVPASLPVPQDGLLAGMIVVGRAIVPSDTGRVSFDCWQTQLTRRGNKRRRHEEMVATTERELNAEAWTTTAGESQIFVELPLRRGPATTLHELSTERPTYEWRLRVSVPTAGADFAAEFVLPVFPVEGGAIARELPPQRTASARAEIWQAAGVREEAHPRAKNGRALLLPAGVGRRAVGLPLGVGVVLGCVAFVLGWSGTWFIALVFILFALLPSLAVGSLWNGGGERLWVEDDAICVERRAGAPIRRLPRAEMVGLDHVSSVSVGYQKFYCVRARCRARADRRREPLFEIASLVRGEEATAEIIVWLSEQGAAALPVQPDLREPPRL